MAETPTVNIQVGALERKVEEGGNILDIRQYVKPFHLLWNSCSRCLEDLAPDLELGFYI